MLVPQNRIVKEVDREYLNILSCLAICEIKVFSERCICQQPSLMLGRTRFKSAGTALFHMGARHANLYNAPPLSLTAKPQ
jgi:hypothetical protein